MKIMKVCTNRSWGGMEAYMVATCAGLRTRGHEIYPVCYRNSRIESELERLEFAPLRLDLWGKFHPLAARKLARYVRRHAIELVHCDFSRDLFTVVPALKFTHRPPLVLQKHIGTWKPKNLPVHPYLYGNVDHVIAISTVIRDNFIANHPIAPERVSVIHPGTDLSRFATDPVVRSRLRAEYQVATDDVLIGIVGRLCFAKGYREFLAVAGRLAAEYPPTRFVLVGGTSRGENDEAGAIIAQAAALGLGDRLFFTGYRDDVPDLLGAMDLFLFPTHAEAFGMVIVEAMAAGVPVISADADGVLDIVVDEVTGLRVDPRDVAALSEATAALVRDPERRRLMGQAGRRRVLAEFSEARMYDRLESLYERLAVASGVGPDQNASPKVR